ncbi:MAG: hypothetical protein DWQ04_09870 [Chloroflexi bacterium]|nr:MAG: hypothetical protein DWQ04_09870 [Chloroflexota bacterium]
MKISFQKKKGDPQLGVLFFWRMQIDVETPCTISDIFIPELFYDYFYIEKGAMRCVDTKQEIDFLLPPQSLKTLYTHRLKFVLDVPIIVFGARLSMSFAESFWMKEMPSNLFMEQNWVTCQGDDLNTFASQMTQTIQENRVKKTVASLFSASLAESDWLRHYSARHKRRLVKSVFGISKKEIVAIRNLHLFLGQTCDFAAQSPRIVEYVNDAAYYDQPHLNHAFKKMTGLSPLAYFEANSILQDNLMAASYNALPDWYDKM